MGRKLTKMTNDVWVSTTSILARASDKPVPEKPAREPNKKPQTKGYKLIGEMTPQVRKTLLTDAQVLACRARYEFEPGWTAKRLAREYGTSAQYMSALLMYRTRSKLIPKRP